MSYTYNYCDFYIDFQGAGYNHPSLQPGEYEAELIAKYGIGSNQTTEEVLTLKANYLVEADNNSTLNYSFTINPTVDSYSINLKPDYTTASPIAEISFFHSDITNGEKSYTVNNPFQIGISSNRNWNYNTIASDYYFKKVGTEGQTNTGYNSITYTPKVNITTNGSTSSTTDKDLLLNAKQTRNNAPIASGGLFGKNKYINEFRLDATVSITK